MRFQSLVAITILFMSRWYNYSYYLFLNYLNSIAFLEYFRITQIELKLAHWLRYNQFAKIWRAILSRPIGFLPMFGPDNGIIYIKASMVRSSRVKHLYSCRRIRRPVAPETNSPRVCRKLLIANGGEICHISEVWRDASTRCALTQQSNPSLIFQLCHLILILSKYHTGEQITSPAAAAPAAGRLPGVIRQRRGQRNSRDCCRNAGAELRAAFAARPQRVSQDASDLPAGLCRQCKLSAGVSHLHGANWGGSVAARRQRYRLCGTATISPEYHKHHSIDERDLKHDQPANQFKECSRPAEFFASGRPLRTWLQRGGTLLPRGQLRSKLHRNFRDHRLQGALSPACMWWALLGTYNVCQNCRTMRTGWARKLLRKGWVCAGPQTQVQKNTSANGCRRRLRLFRSRFALCAVFWAIRSEFTNWMP